ncbi:MAG: aminotransferase class I/II-fold pyridoxal phosphate-dependent enzyme [Bacteroidota bacterium]
MSDSLQFSTRAIQAAQHRFEEAHPVTTPIYLSTTYVRNPDGSYNHDFLYSRSGNPNRELLEKAIADLEQGKVAYCFASGMAAIHAIFQGLRPGDHVLIPDDIYFVIYALLQEVFVPWGLEMSLVDMSDLAKVEAAIQPNTALVWVETPSNPQLKLTDVAAVAQLAKANNCLLAVDNTWPSPVLMQPLSLGADIVMHSTTKYFGGHSDVLGGAVVFKEKSALSERVLRIQALAGGVPAPFDCWLVSRGIQTLSVRVKAQSQTAMQLATFLESHPAIERVLYPGLESHPQHVIAQKQMPNGFGAMLSVLVKGDAERAIEISNALKLFTTATSLGAVESLVEHRKSVEGPESSTPDNLLRLSVGLEAVEDLIEDWRRALDD